MLPQASAISASLKSPNLQNPTVMSGIFLLCDQDEMHCVAFYLAPTYSRWVQLRCLLLTPVWWHDMRWCYRRCTEICSCYMRSCDCPTCHLLLPVIFASSAVVHVLRRDMSRATRCDATCDVRRGDMWCNATCALTRHTMRYDMWYTVTCSPTRPLMWCSMWCDTTYDVMWDVSWCDRAPCW